MKLSRKQFGLGVLGMTSQHDRAQAQGTTPSTSNLPTTPSGEHQATYFFKNSAFEYVMLISLGRAYYQGANIGKVLYVIRQIEDGNFESAYQAVMGAGDEARAMAEETARGGHVESARQAFLWGQNFYDSATYFADGTGDPSRIMTTWQMLDELTYDTSLGGYLTDITEEELRGAPTFYRDQDYARSDRERERELHDYWRAPHYWGV
jgi:hypothetical protein